MIAKVEKKIGVIIQRSFLKESDAIVTALGEEGYFSFYCHGLGKSNKSKSGIVEGAYGEFVLTIKGSNYTCNEFSPLKLMLPKDGLESFALTSFILESVKKLIAEEDGPAAYPWLYGSLSAISEGKEPFCASLIAFAHFLEISGIGLNVDSCSICGSKSNIIGVSFEDGGFVCSSCKPGKASGENREILKIYRYIFKAPFSDFGRVKFSKELALPILLELVLHAEKSLGLTWHSLDILKRL